MLDVVGNHVGPVGTDYSSIVPFNNTSNYHSYCIIQNNDFNGGNQTAVEFCRLAGLPDLDQEDSTTANLILNWIQSIVSTYKFDGIRIDTVPEVPKWFWTQFAEKAGVYQVGEVFSGDYGYDCGYQAPSGPLDGILNYPLYFQLRNQFQSGQSMYNFRSMYQSMSCFGNINYLGNFVDNHDNPRFLYQNGNVQGFQAALAYSLTAVGIPIVYYGDEQNFAGGPDPGCREPLWGSMNTGSATYIFIKAIIAARKQYQIWGQQQIERYVNDNLYAFSRGQVFVALTNSHNEVNVNITYHPFSNGQKICNIFYPTTDCLTVTNNQFNLVLLNGETKIFTPSTGEEQLAFLSEDIESLYSH